jgi:hypothetical protein
LWGFIDVMGEELVAPQYEDLGSFSGGLARVQKGGLGGFIERWRGEASRRARRRSERAFAKLYRRSVVSFSPPIVCG